MKAVHISITVFFCILMVTACSEKQDFDQLENLEITPTYETSIFYVKAQEILINSIQDLSFFTQDFNFDAFEEPFFAERVLYGVLSYTLENTTSKPIEVSLQFLDVNDAVLDTESFQMDAAPTAILIRDVAYGNTGKSIDIIRNTSKIRLTARNLGDNSSTSTLNDPAIIFRSSAKFTLDLK